MSGTGKRTGGAASPISVTQAARSFSDVVNRAFYRGERFLLMKGGRPVAEIGPVHEARPLTALELGERLPAAPHLSAEDADSFADDLADARDALPASEREPWE